MSADAETALSSAPPSRPHLRRARFDDCDRMVRIKGAPDTETSSHDWRMLWLGNPLWPQLGKEWPIGWVLETDGELVGWFGNIPLAYHFRGERIIATSGRGWVVAPEYRGFALWPLEERFSQPGVELFMDTTISPKTLEIFDEFSNRVPAGDWETIAYYVFGYTAFAARALQKLNACRGSTAAEGRHFRQRPSQDTLRVRDRSDGAVRFAVRQILGGAAAPTPRYAARGT
jgi:hypothetical protein